MTFLVYVPGPPLDRFVEYFYCPAGTMPFACEDVMPAPVFDLKINFGGPVLAWRGETGDRLEIPAEGWCMGVWDTYHAVRWPDRIDYIGVSFRAGGAAALLNIDAASLRNEIAPLDAVFGRSAGDLRDRLQAARTAEARFVMLEQMLTSRLHRAAEVMNIRQLVQAVETGMGALRGDELASQFGMSQKHLITLFNRFVGVPPKTLRRLRRLQQLQQTIEQDSEEPLWTDLAHEHLYYDQAHFNRDFKRLTGTTPSDYFARRRNVRAVRPVHARYVRLLAGG